jgi:steroid delta-isomerase-like uncharacterized protein
MGIIDVVRGHYENIARGDAEGDRQLFAADVVTYEPTMGRTEGIEPFLQYSAGFHTAFPDGHMSIRSYVEADDTVAVQGSFIGTHTGPLQGPAGSVPPTGRSLDLPFADFFRVRDGKVVEHHVYYDQVAFLAALGLMPQPATS